MRGTIIRALAGFYYVRLEDERVIECKARGIFRKTGETPLVGDFVNISIDAGQKGIVEEIGPRRNVFVRPPVANIECMILLACGVNPVSDPFLIDRITVIASLQNAQCIVCVNKADLHPGDDLFAIYEKAGFFTLRTSAITGEGIDALRQATKGKICAFVGNSGVGKSSILNALEPGFALKTAEVSQKLGRGKHTTRHVELFSLSNGAQVADTPGFSSFDIMQMDLSSKEDLQYAFLEFAPYLGKCQFRDCAHVGEKGCAIIAAMTQGEIQKTRHDSYMRLYEKAQEIKSWQKKK